MNNEHTRRELFWLALTLLSVGTLTGCEYCAPAMLLLFIVNASYPTVRTLIESLQIQALN